MSEKFEYLEEYRHPYSACLNLTDSCNLACVYCLDGDTPILMKNGAVKAIKDVQINDEVMSTEEKTEYRKNSTIFPTKVTQLHSHTVSELLRITFDNDRQLLITPNHKVLNGRHKWTDAKNLQAMTGAVIGMSYVPADNSNQNIIYNKDYILGYFIAMWITDGTFHKYDYEFETRYNSRIAVKDLEIIERMKYYCDELDWKYNTYQFLISTQEDLYTPAIYSGAKKNYEYIVNLLKEVKKNQELYLNNTNFIKGFLAACYDAEGHIDKDNHVLSISNSDEFILNMWEQGLQRLGFVTIRDPGKQEANKIIYRSRILTKQYQKSTGELQMKFFDLCQPAVKRKSFSVFHNKTCLTRKYIKTIEKLQGEFIVYNIGTESHTYIANGFAVHNCFVQQQPNFMTFQVAKDGVDWLATNINWWREYTHNPHFKGTITYFGGEPTLMWDEIIAPLTVYIKEKYSDYFNLTITTNGTLLNEERIKFLYNNQIYPLLSIDGIKEVQDYNRPMRDGNSGFDKIIQIIPTLLHYFPYTTFRMTLIPDTLDKFFESYCWAENNHFKNIYFCPNSRIKWKEEELKVLQEQLDLIMARRFINYSNNLQNIGSSQIDNAFKNVLDNDIYRHLNHFPNRKNRTLKRCGLGTGSCSIGYNGDVYGCQEQDSRTKNIFYLGNIYKTGIEKDRHKQLLQSYIQQDLMKTNEDNINCEQCYLKYSCCQSNCPSSAYDTFNSFFIRNYVNCILEKVLYTHAITFMKIFVEQNNQIFKKYLDNIYKEYEEKEEKNNECAN